MGRIAVVNQKGGVAKTTTAVNVAHGLALSGYRVLLIDLDSQGSATLSFGLDLAPATYRLLLAKEPLAKIVVRTRPNLDVLPSDESLADVRDWLAVRSTRSRGILSTLTDAIGKSAEDYDFILMDCGPGLDLITLNALMFADTLLVPVSVDYLSAAGTRLQIETLRGLEEVGGEAKLRYLLPTFYDGRLRRAREILGLLQTHFGSIVTDPIRANTRLAEAPHHGQTIFEYDSNANGAKDYQELVRRILNEQT